MIACPLKLLQAMALEVLQISEDCSLEEASRNRPLLPLTSFAVVARLERREEHHSWDKFLQL